MIRFSATVAMLAIATACTPNGIGVASSASTGGGATHVVDVNLTLNGQMQTPYGPARGMKPEVLTVAVGDKILFMNSDGFAHTSTSISGQPTQFPNGSPFTTAALTQTGSTLSGGWSSGAMQAGAGSQTVLADKAGTYLYGCFFHYGANMRGAIIAQ